jgi:hypothetical protein
MTTTGLRRAFGLAAAYVLAAGSAGCSFGVRAGPTGTIDTAGDPGVQGVVQLTVGVVIPDESAAVAVHTGVGGGGKRASGGGIALASSLSYDAFPHGQRDVGFRVGAAMRGLLGDPAWVGAGAVGGVVVPIAGGRNDERFNHGFVFTPEIEMLVNLSPEQARMAFALGAMFGWHILFDLL